MNTRVPVQTKPSPISAPPARGSLLQRKASQPSTLDSQPTEVPPIVHEVLGSPGQPLDPATRVLMEPHFGHDFSHVRVHTGVRAAESARAVNALAYTVGQNIVLPERVVDNQLLAHELAHVVQQDGGGASVRPESISSPGDLSEREAALAAEAVSAGRSFRPLLATGATVHRQPRDARGRYMKYESPSPEIEKIMIAMRDQLETLRANAESVETVQKELKEEKLKGLSKGQTAVREPIRTFCVITVVGEDGTIKKTVTGEYLVKGRQHAEADAIAKLDGFQIGPRDSVLVMVDQFPCRESCTPLLKSWRAKLKGEFRVFHEVLVDPTTREMGTPKDVALQKRLGRRKTTKKPLVIEMAELPEFTRNPPPKPEPLKTAAPAATAQEPTAASSAKPTPAQEPTAASSAKPTTEPAPEAVTPAQEPTAASSAKPTPAQEPTAASSAKPTTEPAPEAVATAQEPTAAITSVEEKPAEPAPKAQSAKGAVPTIKGRMPTVKGTVETLGPTIAMFGVGILAAYAKSKFEQRRMEHDLDRMKPEIQNLIDRHISQIAKIQLQMPLMTPRIYANVTVRLRYDISYEDQEFTEQRTFTYDGASLESVKINTAPINEHETLPPQGLPLLLRHQDTLITFPIPLQPLSEEQLKEYGERQEFTEQSLQSQSEQGASP